MRLTVALTAMLATSSALALDQQQIDQWIEVMPQVDQWMSVNENAMPVEQPTPGVSLKEVFQQGIENLRKADLYLDFQGLVNRAGFDSVEEWTDVTADITMAMMALSLEGQGDMEAQLDQQMQQLEMMKQNQAMPAEQIQAMEQMLEASRQMLQQANDVDEKDMALVRANQNRLEDLMR